MKKLFTLLFFTGLLLSLALIQSCRSGAADREGSGKDSTSLSQMDTGMTGEATEHSDMQRPAAGAKGTIVFIHGMFQNAQSWESWVKYFEAKGYTCIAQSWPMHEGRPAELRKNTPAGLGDLRLDAVYDKYAALVKAQGSNVILIGHSVGGLLVQKLINNGLGSAGICISSVAPNKMLSVNWNFFKNSLSITNPVKGDKPFKMDAKGFHENFCNTMSEAESNEAYERTATNDSRNVLRDCLLGPGEIKLENTNKPLLFIGGEKDHIIPAGLNEKNAKAYPGGLADFKEFPNRGHFICGQPGWEEVAAYVAEWLSRKEKKELAIK